jgi:hypothetical protein
MVRYYYHGWTKDEERMLKEIMLNGGRKKAHELFLEASERLERTVAACQNRWHVIKPKKEAV